jgi:hypothetical protein
VYDHGFDVLVKWMLWLRLGTIILYSVVFLLLIIFDWIEFFNDERRDVSKTNKQDKMKKYLKSTAKTYEVINGGEQSCPICLDEFKSDKKRNISEL